MKALALVIALSSLVLLAGCGESAPANDAANQGAGSTTAVDGKDREGGGGADSKEATL